MIYRHVESSVLYRQLVNYFCVHRQEHCKTYISLETGEVFGREIKDFLNKFEYVSDPQNDLVSKVRTKEKVGQGYDRT